MGYDFQHTLAWWNYLYAAVLYEPAFLVLMLCSDCWRPITQRCAAQSLWQAVKREFAFQHITNVSDISYFKFDNPLFFINPSQVWIISYPLVSLSGENHSSIVPGVFV
jgi:hypothetical protein